MNWFTSLFAVFKDEFYDITNSWYLIGLVSFIPLLGYGMLIMIFHQGVIHDAPIAVVDLDKSQLSRMLLSDMESSSTLHIKMAANSTAEAASSMRQSDVYAAVIIPSHFERDVRLGIQPDITAMINTQYILLGKTITAALTETLLQSAARVDVLKHLASVERTEAAVSAVAPIGIQITPLFNTYKNYFPFLVGALLPALWQVFIVITMIVSVGRVFKMQRQLEWLEKANHSVSAALLGKMLPYTLIFFIHGVLMVTYLFIVQPWPFAGSWTVLLSAVLLTVIVYQIIALALFSTGFDYTRALSLGAVYTAPAFAFLGVTFPAHNMGDFALFWHDLLPIVHYMQIQIAEANYGASLSSIGFEWGALSLFLLLLPVVIWRYKSVLKTHR